MEDQPPNSKEYGSLPLSMIKDFNNIQKQNKNKRDEKVVKINLIDNKPKKDE